MRAPPRSFSQLATSFLAGLRQGIPRALLHRLALLPCIPKDTSNSALTSQPKALAPSLSAPSLIPVLSNSRDSCESRNNEIEMSMDWMVRQSSGFSVGHPVGCDLLAVLQKGGDPAAGSPTATLLRLRPSHQARLRPLPPLRVGPRTSGAPSSHGVTGGVYKARERIHRGVADPRLLAIPASRGRVADRDPNLDRLFGIRSGLRPCSPLYRPL